MSDATMTAAGLARATPDSRDRYMDLLRVASLGAVILGHWLMAVVVVEPDGGVRATNALAILPSLQPLTWLLQVMPVFFLVGGFAHATALASVRRRGGSYADFVRNRAGRLLRPTAVFVGVWLALALVIELLGQDRGVLKLATRVVAQPLWFVGVYLGVIALAPAMLRLHRWLGARAVAAPVALAAAAGAVDLARFGGQVPYVGYLNVAFVWLAVHQLGFLYADGTLRRGGRRLGLALAGGGLAVTLALTAYGPYPMSMVGLPGDRVSNMSPPTFALLAHAIWLTGLVLLARGPVSRWLRGPRVWPAVIAANGYAMTAFLWHLTAMFAATALAIALGTAQPAVGSPTWWLLRPAWIAVLVLFTLALIMIFRNADRLPPRAAPPRRAAAPPRAPGRPGIRRTIAGAAGAALCVVGVLGISAVGFGGLLAGRTATLVVLPVTPLRSAVIVAAGAAILWATGRRYADQPDQRSTSIASTGPSGRSLR